MDTNLKEIADLLVKECTRLAMEEIIVYDVEGQSPLTDMVLIAAAGHTLQISAARNSLALIGKQNGLPLRNPTEDYSEGWLAMDHGDFVIHILTPEKRAFYDLDSLMKGIYASRELAALEDEAEKESPELSDEELLRLNAEFDFLNEGELPKNDRKD